MCQGKILRWQQSRNFKWWSTQHLQYRRCTCDTDTQDTCDHGHLQGGVTSVAGRLPGLWQWLSITDYKMHHRSNMCLQLFSSYSYLNPPNRVKTVCVKITVMFTLPNPVVNSLATYLWSLSLLLDILSSLKFPDPTHSWFPSSLPGCSLLVHISASSLLLHLLVLAWLCSQLWLPSLSTLSPVGEITSLMPLSTAMVRMFVSPQMRMLNPNPWRWCC